MADWSYPTAASLYLDVISYFQGRDVDAATMFVSAPSNQPTGAMKYDRTGNLFTEWSGTAWIDKTISISGGGTGATTAAGARTALGLGTMSTQNNNAVSITGGTITGVSLDAGLLGSGVVALARGGTGSSLGLGANGTFLQSNGTNVVFGVDGTQLTNLNAAQITSGTLPDARLSSNILNQFPVGGGCIWFTNTPPTNYILADGSVLAQAGTYAALYALFGTTYNTGGEGGGNFRVPDLRQRFPLGKAASGTGNTLGATGGVIDHTHTGPSHIHTYTDVVNHTHTITDPGHIHSITDPTHDHVTHGIPGGAIGIAAGTDGTAVVPSGYISPGSASTGISIVSHSTGITATNNPTSGVATGTTAAGGTGATGSNNPPYLVVNYIIRYQ